MRMPRIKLRGRVGVYHCVTRVVGGQYLLKDFCKERFRRMLWQEAEFCGLQVLTYCVMTNHVHVLVRVPQEQPLTDRVIVQRALVLYGKNSVLGAILTKSLNRTGAIPPDLRQSLTQRMGDVSVFMKELKQRFSKWYNRQHGRYGTLWAERFKSVLVEDQPGALRQVASYIDLNPVRAGMVKDPKDYRWSGYGEAMAGKGKARAGVCLIEHREPWQEAVKEYRRYLYLQGAESGHSEKKALEPSQIRKVYEKGGELSEAEALRLRIRYFTDGLVLGSEGFVNEVFAEYRDRFSAKRRTGARKLGRLPFGELRTCRSLRVDVVG